MRATPSPEIAPPPPMHERCAEPAVALSFDDGPDPIWTPRVLAALDRAEAGATFFLSTPRHPDLVRRIATAGHECAFHCERHVRHSERGDELELELERGLEWLAGLGVEVRRWRPPWGKPTEASAAIAARFGLELWGWSDDTEDWSGRSTDAMLADLAAELTPGAVVLMHDGLGPGARRAGCEQTVALIEPLAALIRSRGLAPSAIRSALPAAQPAAI